MITMGSAAAANRRGAGGFTLIEVLVALTIAAIALMAALRATASMATGAEDLRARTVGQWSAENRLSLIRITGEWPAVGQRTFDCSQAEIALVCQEQVFATPNPSFRRVELSVRAAADSRQVARLTGFATQGP